MIKKVAAVALGAAVLLPLLAWARHADVVDPNDTRGLLDVRRVEVVRGSPPKWKVTTWSGWKPIEIWDRGFSFVYVDTFGTNRADYYVLVRSDGSGLRAVLYRDRARGKDRKIRAVRVRHPSARTQNVTIPVARLRRRDTRIYRWYVLTMISGDRCKQFCFDRAPDSGSVAEPGPAPTPTLPTPSPTVTP